MGGVGWWVWSSDFNDGFWVLVFGFGVLVLFFFCLGFWSEMNVRACRELCQNWVIVRTSKAWTFEHFQPFEYGPFNLLGMIF